MGWLIIFMLGLFAFAVLGLNSSSQSSDLQSIQVSSSASTPGPSVIIKMNNADSIGGIRRHYGGWREWRRADPTLINSLWKSKMGNGIRKQLGKAEIYIILALLIGFVTVVIGCWLSDNCWTPEPEDSLYTLA
ncbi:uncharacterized protein LOC108736156 [Agrilus planipennis]|uniref:Uncharacterized protein LOC108736156 n=1 Tax=Agrilus planipennis TaxID=224129 RepID=A0A1W4WJ64_AGRPL|nr:uncharacterized protein LOC108736156 [Agrilus planipennis]